jgi:threonine/homoserine efflux transporter RhtA
MNVHLSIGPVLAIIAGFIILFVPKLLNYIVAIYLIIIGFLGIFGVSHITL